MTQYVFNYDVEHPELCIKATRILVALHRKYEVPATFFILGKVIEQKRDELRNIFDGDELFDIQSHTYSHKLIKDSLMHGAGIPVDELYTEVAVGKRLVEDAFERPCIGMRSGCGFYKGLQGERERLAVIWECGLRFISTDLRGPADSIPSGLQQAYWYDEEGFGQLLELPGHGWHDNVLKEPKGALAPRLMLPWPYMLPWGIPTRPTRTPQEELEVQKVWIERAIECGVDYVALVYHPHSIYLLSEDCRIIELLIRYVLDRGLRTTTYRALYEHYATHPENVPGRNAWSWEREISNVPFAVSGAKHW